MAGFSNFIRRFVGRLRDQESDAPESRLPEAIPGLDRDPAPEPLDVSDGVVGRDPTALSVDAPLATPDAGGIPARPAQNPEFAFTSERMATPTAEFAGAAVAEPATTPMDDGGLLDDDVLREDPLSTACPYCGLVDQRVGARCQRCSQVVVRLPAWAQHRRHNWLFARLSWKRLIFASIVALLIVLVVWVNYPFAPNPLILLKKIQSQMTADEIGRAHV